MVKRLLFACAFVLTGYPVSAATLVTWQGAGAVTISRPAFPDFPNDPHFDPAPPVGTPISLTLSFDPAQIAPTSFAQNPGCNTVPASGSLTLGGDNYALAGFGHTHASVPFSHCSSRGPFTEFGLAVTALDPDPLWLLDNTRGILILSFVDRLVTETFPASPTTTSATLDWFAWNAQFSMRFDSRIDLHGADQLTPVPEPGTLTLVGLGLIAAYRKRHARTS